MTEATLRTDDVVEALDILATRVPTTNPQFSDALRSAVVTLFKDAADAASSDKKVAGQIVDKLGVIANLTVSSGSANSTGLKMLSEGAIGSLSLIGAQSADSDVQKSAVKALARVFNALSEENKLAAVAGLKAVAVARPEQWWQSLEKAFDEVVTTRDNRDRFVNELKNGVRDALWSANQQALAALLLKP